MDGPHGVFSIDEYEGAGFCLSPVGWGSRERIDEITTRLNMTTVHVLEEPPPELNEARQLSAVSGPMPNTVEG